MQILRRKNFGEKAKKPLSNMKEIAAKTAQIYADLFIDHFEDYEKVLGRKIAIETILQEAITAALKKYQETTEINFETLITTDNRFTTKF